MKRLFLCAAEGLILRAGRLKATAVLLEGLEVAIEGLVRQPQCLEIGVAGTFPLAE